MSTLSPLGGEPTWSPNQQAVRARIADAAARLAAREGLGACTIRAVADEAGLKKSTVHYYVDDANELVDMAVITFLSALAEHARVRMAEAADGSAALCVLVRVFMGRESGPIPLRDPTLWASYTTHAWKRGARREIITCFDTFSALAEEALGRSNVPDIGQRARSVHHYLLGAVQRNMIDPLPAVEVAAAVSALSGLDIDPARC